MAWLNCYQYRINCHKIEMTRCFWQRMKGAAMKVHKFRKVFLAGIGIAFLGCSIVPSTFYGGNVKERIVYASEYGLDNNWNIPETEIPNVATAPAIITTQSAIAATQSAIVITQPAISTGGSVVETEEADVFFSEDMCKVYLSRSKKLKPKFKDNIKDNYTWVFASKNKKVATVSSDGVVKGLSLGTTKITIRAKEDSGLSASIVVKVVKEKKGWHTTASGKRYYVKKDGMRKTGYFKVGQDYYYAPSSSYVVTNDWRYVNFSGKKYKLYFGKKGKQKQDVSSLLGEQDQYKIEVNTSQNIVIVFAKDENGTFNIPVKAMVCSCGVPGHSTIKGTYKHLRRAGVWHTLYYGTYGKYCTRINGPYLFHSVVYSKYGDEYSLYKEEYEKLGEAASHGCVRLQVKDAKWIYRRYKKCIVELYASDKKMPLAKPVAKPVVDLGGNRVCDPTDTDVN